MSRIAASARIAIPIGSWIDYLIVLWVLAALVAGLVIFVVAWLRRGPV